MNARFYKPIVSVLVIVVLALGLVPLTSAQEGNAPDYWPTEGWHTSTPEEQGMNSETLAAMLSLIQEKEYPVHNILIIRNGSIVLEANVYPSRPNERHILYSATKSVTSALVGIAVRDGYIESVDQSVLGFFPERTFAKVDERKQALTVEHLLTMMSGLFEMTKDMERSDDWVQFALDQPMGGKPGVAGHYVDLNTHLLMAVVHATTQRDPFAYAQAELFGPLGISDVAWPTDPQGIPIGYSELRMTPRDLAKIGYLYLHEGQWDGAQIVPVDWVTESTTPHSKPFGIDYGYQWWIFSGTGLYAASGALGQWLMVVPDQDLIVVFTSGFTSARTSNFPPAWGDEYILAAVESDDPLPENPEGAALLAAHIETLAQPEAQPAPPLPATASSVAGKTYALEPNALGWEALSLTFDNDEALLSIAYADHQLVLPIGLDDVFRVTPVGDWQFLTDEFPGTPGDRTSSLALKGYWKNDTTFEVTMRLFGFVEEFSFRLRFEDNDLSVRVTEDVARMWGEVEHSGISFDGIAD